MKTRRKISKSFRLFDFKADDCNDINDPDTNLYAIDKPFYIEMFGINEIGKSCSILVTDYKPFFYVKVDERWNADESRKLMRELNQKLSDGKKKGVLSVEMVKHNQLYGFTAGEKSNFVKIEFANKWTMNKVKNMWYSGSGDERIRKGYKYKAGYRIINLELYESNIPPLLRFLHVFEISPSGWVSIPSDKQLTDYTKCDFEFICKLSDITPLPEKETAVPYKIMSFDIEADSSHGDFPMPVKNYKKLATNVCDIFIKKKLSKDEGKKIFKKIIIKAFYPNEKIISLKMDVVDQVFPKIEYDKKTIESVIGIVLTDNIDNLTINNDNSENISSYFNNKEDSDDEDEKENIQKLIN